jgi:hypothetical protein
MLLIGFTSFFLAHKKDLGLNEIDMTPYVAWLPGYGEGAMQGQHLELRSVLQLPDGRQVVGTNVGLFELTAAGPVSVQALEGMQVRNLAMTGEGLLAATKEGVWLERAGAWQQVLAGDAWNANSAADGSVTVALKEQGLFISHDGLNWLAWQGADVAGAFAGMRDTELPRERVTLGKLVTDLHTGKAFMGKTGEWVWIDLLALVWVFLGFTGLWLWWRAQTRRRDAAVKRVQAGAARTDA